MQYEWSAERLKSAMDAAEVGATALALRVGTNRDAVYKWLKGVRPSAELLLRVADALDVAPAWLCGGVEDELARLARRMPAELRERAARTLSAAFDEPDDYRAALVREAERHTPASAARAENIPRAADVATPRAADPHVAR